MSVKALDHGTRKQRKQIDLIVKASEGKRLRRGKLRGTTNARLSHKVRLCHLQRLIVNLNEAVSAVRQEMSWLLLRLHCEQNSHDFLFMGSFHFFGLKVSQLL